MHAYTICLASSFHIQVVEFFYAIEIFFHVPWLLGHCLVASTNLYRLHRRCWGGRSGRRLVGGVGCRKRSHAGCLEGGGVLLSRSFGGDVGGWGGWDDCALPNERGLAHLS